MSLDRSDVPITYGDLKRLFFRVKGSLKRVFWIAGGSIAMVLFCTPPTFLARATFKEGRITASSDTEWKEWFQKIGGTSGKTTARSLMQSESLLRTVVCELGMQVERVPRFAIREFFQGFWNNVRLMLGRRPVEQEAFEFCSTVYQGELSKIFWIEVVDSSTFALFDVAQKELGRWRVGEKIQCSDFSGYLTHIPSWAMPRQRYRFAWIPWVETVKRVKKCLAIRPLHRTESSLLVLSFRDRNRHRAATFLNQLMDAFRQRLYLENETIVSAQLTYLAERKKELLSQWDGALRDHVAYLKENLEKGEGGDFAGELEALQAPRNEFLHRLIGIDAEIRRIQWQEPLEKSERPLKNESKAIQELVTLKQQKVEAEEALGALQEGKDPLSKLSLLNDPRTLVGLWAQQIMAHQGEVGRSLFYQKQWKTHLEGFLEQADCKIKTLEERQAFGQSIAPPFEGLTLSAAQKLLSDYHEQRDQLQSQWRQLVYLAEQLYEPRFELSSISTILSDPVTQQLVMQAGDTAVRLQDVGNRSLREQESLQETLVTQKRFLEQHLSQMVELTKLRLALAEDQINALKKTVFQLLTHEKQILEEQLEKIGQKMGGLPEKWRRENILSFNKGLGIQMMEGLAQVMEMKHLDRYLYQVESKVLDEAMPPLFPENPWLLLPLALLGALLCSGGYYLFHFFRALIQGFPISHEVLSLCGWHSCGTLFGARYEKAEHLVGNDLDVLRKAANFLQGKLSSAAHEKGFQKKALICAVLGGSYPDFTPALAELLAMRQRRVLLIRYVFNEVVPSGQRIGLWSYLQGETDVCPTEKRGEYDFITSGSTTRFGMEGLNHPRFQILLETMEPIYDVILIYSHATLKEAEGEALLSLAEATLVVLRDETLDALEIYQRHRSSSGLICFS